jgi:hypothetical protein
VIHGLWCLQTLLIWWGGYGEIDNEIDNLDNLVRTMGARRRRRRIIQSI